MGKKSRTKALRRELREKLQAAGLKDEHTLVVSKTRMVPELIMGKDGKPVLDENKRPRFRIRKVEHMTAKNPLKGLIRRLMKEDESVIRAFLKQPLGNQEMGSGESAS